VHVKKEEEDDGRKKYASPEELKEAQNNANKRAWDYAKEFYDAARIEDEHSLDDDDEEPSAADQEVPQSAEDKA